jgi:hypothetical protein
MRSSRQGFASMPWKCLLRKCRSFIRKQIATRVLAGAAPVAFTTPSEAMSSLRSTNSGSLFNIVAFRPNTHLFGSQQRASNGFPVETSVRGPCLGGFSPYAEGDEASNLTLADADAPNRGDISMGRHINNERRSFGDQARSQCCGSRRSGHEILYTPYHAGRDVARGGYLLCAAKRQFARRIGEGKALRRVDRTSRPKAYQSSAAFMMNDRYTTAVGAMRSLLWKASGPPIPLDETAIQVCRVG